MRRVVVLSVGVFSVLMSGVARADEQPTQPNMPMQPPVAASAPSSPMSIDQLQQMFRDAQQKDLERLKETDPQAYAQRQIELERYDQIQTIVTGYREGRVKEDAARQQLAPLIRSDVQASMQGLDGQIEYVEQQLAKLKAAKQDPDVLVQERIDQLLGKAPNPLQMLMEGQQRE